MSSYEISIKLGDDTIKNCVCPTYHKTAYKKNKIICKIYFIHTICPKMKCDKYEFESTIPLKFYIMNS